VLLLLQVQQVGQDLLARVVMLAIPARQELSVSLVLLVLRASLAALVSPVSLCTSWI